MFFANSMHGQRTHIEDADPNETYVCPACGCAMIQKRGNINAHHFAHKAAKECDPWYTGKLSPWHAKMQNLFSPSCQEVIIWNATHTEYHIADVALQKGDKKYVIEFQHSSISQSEFLMRTQFYIKCGYKVIWIFDFCDNRHPKRLYISGTESEGNTIRLVWPGKDRIRFLDYIDFSGLVNCLYITFYINTGIGELQLHEPDGYIPWETWEYEDPFSRHPCFVLLRLDYFNEIDDFFAEYYSESDFLKLLRSLE